MATLRMNSETERRPIRQKLLELAIANDEVFACNEAALQGAMMFDRMEDEDARRRG